MWIRNFRRLIGVVLLVLFCGGVYGQSRQSVVKIYFKQSGSQIVEVDSEVGSLGDIERVEIRSGGSPEGGVAFNQWLSDRRGEVARQYIMESVGVDDSLISLTSVGVDWEAFRRHIEAYSTPYRDEVLWVLDNIPPESRVKYLKEIQAGVPYSYMMQSLFPRLRMAEVVIYYRDEEPTVERAVEPIEELAEEVVFEIKPLEHRALFAIKSNLLFDMLSLINLEVEVPIGVRYSVAGEMIFPWWSMDNHRNRIQILNINLEGRYWWGDRADVPILTGWFTGLYAGGGLYDLEYRGEGYQGEFFIAAGLSGGYAHMINRSRTLRLEYSLGVGFLSTNYDYYEACYCCNDRWHAVRQRSGRYSWVGPTRARVSLSYMIDLKRRRWGEDYE